MRAWGQSLASLSRLRSQHCRDLRFGSRTRLGSGLAVPVGSAGGRSSDSTHRLGTSNYGLPEICEHGNHSAGSTFGERRAEVIAKINRKFSPTELNFINLAKILGYEISIKTVPPSICGISRCGEKLGGNISARFYWIVLVHGIKVTYARSGITVCGEPLCHISYAQDLECLFKRIKPAHTIVKFRYV